MKIFTKQIDEPSLTAFVTGVAGTSLSGQFNSYVQNGGYLGVNVVYTSGGLQVISGAKTFDVSPFVPYFGATGTAPSRKYVDDQLAGSGVNLNNNILLTGSGILNAIFNTGSNLSALRVTGSNVIQDANLSGIGGTVVIKSGNFILISGAIAGGGGGGGSDHGDGINLSGNLTNTGALLSSLRVTGSDNLQIANISGFGGTVVFQSGSFVLISGGGGAGSSNVSVTGSNPIANPNFSGIGSVSLIQSGNLILISGGVGTQFNTINYFSITGTGTVNNSFNTSGNIINNFIENTNNTNFYNITGNPINISFFLDPVGTGLNLIESFVSNSFVFTGAAFSCRTSGFGPINGGIMSGKLYQVDFNNTEQTLLNFTFTTGMVYSGSPTFNTVVSGRNRVGLTLTNLISGIQKFSVGVFGI